MHHFNIYVPTHNQYIHEKPVTTALPLQRKYSVKESQLKGHSVINYSAASTTANSNANFKSQPPTSPNHMRKLRNYSVYDNEPTERGPQEIQFIEEKKMALISECNKYIEKIKVYQSKEQYLIERESKLDQLQKYLEEKGNSLINEENKLTKKQQKITNEQEKLNQERIEMQKQKESFLQTVATVISQKKNQCITEQMLNIMQMRNNQNIKTHDYKAKQIYEEEQDIASKRNDLNKKEIQLLQKESALETREKKVSEEESMLSKARLEHDEQIQNLRERENKVKIIESQIISYKETDNGLELKKIGMDMLQEILTKKSEIETQTLMEQKSKLAKMGNDLIKEKKMINDRKANDENTNRSNY